MPHSSRQQAKKDLGRLWRDHAPRHTSAGANPAATALARAARRAPAHGRGRAPAAWLRPVPRKRCELGSGSTATASTGACGFCGPFRTLRRALTCAAGASVAPCARSALAGRPARWVSAQFSRTHTARTHDDTNALQSISCERGAPNGLRMWGRPGEASGCSAEWEALAAYAAGAGGTGQAQGASERQVRSRGAARVYTANVSARWDIRGTGSRPARGRGSDPCEGPPGNGLQSDVSRISRDLADRNESSGRGARAASARCACVAGVCRYTAVWYCQIQLLGTLMTRAVMCFVRSGAHAC